MFQNIKLKSDKPIAPDKKFNQEIPKRNRSITEAVKRRLKNAICTPWSDGVDRHPF
jgi:hypothetical protein